MSKNSSFIACIILCLSLLKVQAQKSDRYMEKYRPQIHFSPQAHWINDPNGMVFYSGVYHLFFQYYPDGTTWGPMHWGHAESKDLIHWKQLATALYPDSLGYIFSGSAVVDSNNTSGFGKDGKIPLVAIFTHHDPIGEKVGTNTFQNQSIAYSLDNGNSWTKYSGNPVLKNPGIRDFRDPKVMWYAKEKKWIMTLATLDHITFYSSPDFKNWEKESEFGKASGAHGGVWECPDLFPLTLEGKTYWVLIVNLNPGGPNGGSATQYFIGQFDGNKFVANDSKTKWVDFGPDEYAGITWSNTGERKIFLGWMSNWQYAGQVPTEKWRNAMTVPRELQLVDVKGNMFLTSAPVKELNTITQKDKAKSIFENNKSTQNLPTQFKLKFNVNHLNDFSIKLSNQSGDELTLGYNKSQNRYFINRSKSGIVDFNRQFAGTFYAPRLSQLPKADFEVIVDASSVEFFADKGLSVMTCIYFPNSPLTKLNLENNRKLKIENFQLFPLTSIWK